MAGRYKLTNPLEVSREIKKKANGPGPKAAAEDDNPTSSIELGATEDTITERPVLVPLKDKEVMQSIGLIRQYLRDTGVNANINKFTIALLQSNVIPYNPYPGFVRRFLRVCEKFHTRRETLPQVQRRISQCPTFVTGSGVLSGVKLPNAKLWGLQHLLTAVNPKVLNIYRNLVKSATVSQQKITQVIGDNISFMTTLKGPCIFSGSLHEKCFKINVCVCIMVRTSSFQEAARDFGKAVLCDIAHILKDTDHCIMSLHVPVVDTEISLKMDWAAEELQALLSSETSQARKDLVRVIGSSALKKQNCMVQLLMCCDDTANMLKTGYMRCEKSYNLMTLLTSSSQSRIGGNQTNLYISNVPYQMLHEGVFIEQNEAELYLSTFKKFSSSKAPLSQEVSTAVQRVWQSRVAGRQLESDLSFIIHYQWLIERIQNQAKAALNKSEESLGIQISRSLQGFGVKLENIISLITMLYEITDSKISKEQPQLFSDVFYKCQECLLEYFNGEFHELPVAFARTTAVCTLSQIEALLKDKKFDEIQPYLNFIKGYLRASSISLIEDALDEFPAIRDTHTQIGSISQMEFGRNLHVDLRPTAFRHKSEATTYTDIDRKQIDVSVSAANFAVPPKISQQASRMQYCIDIRIDEVWKEFMHNLFIMRDSPPPNPYPTLISLLRQASLKMQLFREDNSAVVRKLLSTKPRLHDENLHLYSIPAISAYGTYGAVSPLSAVGFRQVSAMASTVAISSPQSSNGAPAISTGGFEIRCLMAISGEALFYGSASPYLTFINTHEYCFIKGPKTQESDGILGLAKILLIYLGNLQTQGILTVKAVFSDTEIQLNDLNAASTRFQNLFASIANSRQPVFLHVLIPLDWRYVCVKKAIHIHFIDEMNDNVKFVTEHNPTAPHQQVFLNGHDATEYTKRIRIFKTNASTALEQVIKEAYGKYDWTALAQLALCWSVKSENVDNLDKTTMESTGFCWKLLHSPCGSLLYCMALNNAITDGIKYKKNSGSNGTTIKDRLRTMLFGYRNCLHLTLTSQSTMAAKAINPHCQNLLQGTAPCDLTTGTADMAREEQLSAVLTHINSLTQALADWIAVDLVHCMPSMVSLTTKKLRRVNDVASDF